MQIYTEKILRENNWPEDYIRVVLSHGWKLVTDVEPIHPMEKVIYTIDEAYWLNLCYGNRAPK